MMFCDLIVRAEKPEKPKPPAYKKVQLIFQIPNSSHPQI
jgi:hypothetical protein